MTDQQPSTAARHFPPDFLWGAATSAFQIEGGAGDRGRSIWDDFCDTPGAIADGSNGAMACDHYGRWRSDVDLMAELGLKAYRFSIAWPRVIPDGTGTVNQVGLDFYRRLVDALVEAGIAPYPTLYHWDLPSALEARGGWRNRDTAAAFAQYAGVVAEALGDRVQRWATLNEPFVSAHHGHLTGEHAPGVRSVEAWLAAAHHLLLGHGLAVDALRQAASGIEVGIVLNFTPTVAASDDEADRAAAAHVDAVENRWFVEPIDAMGYPADAVARLGWDQAEVADGDLDVVAAPVDFLGVNYYTRSRVAADGPVDPPPDVPTTEMGWEVHAPSLESQLRRLHRDHSFGRYLITENGAAMADRRVVDGVVVDDDRIDYLHQHLLAVHRAREAGVPVEGYFVWSLLDNFEWAHGYDKRFGIVHVDPVSLVRTPKASARWYSQVARTGIIGSG